MNISLPDDLYSPEQLSLVIIELRAYAGQLRDRAVRQKVTKSSGETMPPLSIVCNQLLEANNVTPSDVKGIESMLHSLETSRLKMPVARLILADIPDSAGRTILTNWFRTHIDPHSLLTFTSRPDIGGGFLLQAGSKQYDFSFRTQLNNNKMHLAEIFASGR